MREAELHAELKMGGFSNRDDINLTLENMDKRHNLNYKPLIEKYNQLLQEAQQSFIQDLTGIQNELCTSRDYILSLQQEKQDI